MAYDSRTPLFQETNLYDRLQNYDRSECYVNLNRPGVLSIKSNSVSVFYQIQSRYFGFEFRPLFDRFKTIFDPLSRGYTAPRCQRIPRFGPTLSTVDIENTIYPGKSRKRSNNPHLVCLYRDPCLQIITTTRAWVVQDLAFILRFTIFVYICSNTYKNIYLKRNMRLNYRRVKIHSFCSFLDYLYVF